MLPVILAVVLSAGGGGSAPAPVAYAFMGASFAADTPTDEPRGTLRAPQAGTLTELHWEVGIAGTDGGGSTFTLSVTVQGVAQCSASIACTATGEGSQACSASFASGDDIHIAVTASGCTTLPRFVTSATWRW
jgi:hypothetical protein